MTSKYWTWAALLLLGLLSLSACEKDKMILESTEITQTPADPNSFVRFSWSEKEAQFFSLTSPIPTNDLAAIDERNGTNRVYHPLLIDVYNFIAMENEGAAYAESLVDHLGLPYWEKSLVYVNALTNEQLLHIPFFANASDKFSGLLSAKAKEGGGYIINGISRQNLLRSEEGDAAQRAGYAEWMLEYQKYLLGTSNDEELKDAYCKYRDREETEGRNPPPSCEWILVEMCSDLDTQTSWIGGHTNIPPHLDHDQDGILNEDDQDWHEFLQRYGITQENWTAFVYEYWETHHADEGDYEEYWGNGYYNWDDYETIFQEMWDDWWDEWFGPEGPDDTNWGPYPDPEIDPPYAYCWDGGGLDQVDEREVRCMFMYLLYCEGAGTNWWESADIVVCDGCSDQDLDDWNQQQAFHQRIQEFIQEFNLQDHESLIYSLVQPGDFPVLGHDEIVNEMLASILLSHFSAEHSGIMLTIEEESWLIGHPEIIGELLMASEITGQGQSNESYLESFIQVASVLELESETAILLLYENQMIQATEVFLEENAGNELSIAFARFLFEDYNEWGGSISLETLNPFEEYANNLAILESITPSAPPEIENGIEILDSYLYGFPQTPTGTPLGGAEANPLGGPDLEFGTQGDVTILTLGNQLLADLPASDQERRLKWLFFMGTFLDAAGEAVADDYLEQFHENEAVFDHYNETLSTMVMNSTKMRNWLKDYGKVLNDQLTVTEGDINTVSLPLIDRTSLNETHALTILINDTQEINVSRLDSYSFNAESGEWDCYFVVNVIDNFGLDDGDVIEFQNYIPGGNGFVAWWTLQHRYGWAPFRTDIWFVVRLSGQI